MTTLFSSADLEAARARGIEAGELDRQLALFARPPAPTCLARPCTTGDGVRQIGQEDQETLQALWRAAAEAGRFTKFVPASGAASRMFAFLERAAADPEDEATAADARRFIDKLDRLPFYEQLQALAEERDTSVDQIVTAGVGTLDRWVRSADGLDLGDRPKGLLAFHTYPDGTRTAFTEHVYEALGYCAPADGAVRLHFTVLPRHQEAFERDARREIRHLASGHDAHVEIAFSSQSPATDTLAVDADNRPFRDGDGGLLFRPAGHGALLGNLRELAERGGDLVFIKNIDNIPPERQHSENARWKRILAGLLVDLERRAATLAQELATEPTPEVVERARLFVERELCLEAPLDLQDQEKLASFLADRLGRPIRVCGVVPNSGEPGGGPFWVRDATGALTGQIVEPGQIDRSDAEQETVWRESTHFNPVDLVCTLRDRQSRPYDLECFVDPATSFISTKTEQGRPLKALERPGLWNGSMAGWNTVFVEVPAATFTPVKTILDLLRPEHQPLP